MIKKCLLVSFDFTKPDYPSISYSVASILAKFKNSNIIDIESYSFDLNEFISTPKDKIEEIISERFRGEYLEKINDYSFIAIAAYAWSENIVKELIKVICSKFNGKIILGGYEITALSEEKLSLIYPNVDFYIKGYAEKALEKIFKDEISSKIVYERIDEDDIVSPYLSEVLPINTKKIHWESKRGCPYHCDYCEYGAAINRGKPTIIRINHDRLEKEISLFKHSSIQEINVLDATFLVKDEDNNILLKLLSGTNCKICLQMHFSAVRNDKGKEFFEICRKYKDRISLEFGLQTIHEKEMEILKRNNKIPYVETIMKQLNDAEIKYSISIIFGIPHQTIDSFKQTIEFIERNNCKEFYAYPLQLPKNSKIRDKIDDLKIKEFQGDHFSLSFVSECCSFNNDEWKEMYNIVTSHENKPPFCGDPIDGTKSISEKILCSYLNGGIQGKLNGKQKPKRSIFWM